MEVVVPEEFRYLYVKTEARPVVKIPDPVLRQKAFEIAKITRKTQLLIDEMLKIMKQANGIGLAAPQVGILQRLIVVSPEGMRPTALINPKVVKSEGAAVGEEGCLSIPGLYGDVERAAAVEVHALDRKGRQVKLSLQGLKARVVQHEIDHLDGVLFIDKVNPATLHWTNPEKAGVAE
ncbi:MAG TPA: peptide deformylase [Fimbriimonas sp.]|nr:peptide deformylase [Fimbriimonas sp.]